MSGFAAIVHLDNNRVEESVLTAAATAMRRRGPDAQRISAAGSVGLVHAALITTPEAVNEQQPLRLNHCWISADVRLDNRPTLFCHFERQQLPLKKEDGDAAYILGAYLLWGAACVDFLLGDFAFAIWDETQQRLFAARDHFGTKPLCYYHDPHRIFACASEISALLTIPQVPEQINEARIADYIVSQLEGRDKVSTFFQHILRLPPAHTLVVENNQLTIKQYWKLEPPQPIRMASDAEYTEAFLDHFSEAVRCRLRAPAASQVGIMLSGGIDSSSIVGVARHLLTAGQGDMLKTFSAISDHGLQNEETCCIQAMIAGDGLRSVTVKPSQMPAYLAELAYLPRHNTNLFSNWLGLPQLVYLAAKRDGVNVVLDGVGGDETTSMGGWYIGLLLRARQWQLAWQEAKGYHEYYGDDTDSPAWLLFKGLQHAFAPNFLRFIRQKLATATAYRQPLAETAIHPDFAAAQNLQRSLAVLNRSYNVSAQLSAAQRQAGWLNLPYIPVALERYDHVAATHAVEPRRPYLDKRLVEFSLALPISQKMRNGWPKFVVRSAMNGLVPDPVRWHKRNVHLGWEFTTKRHQLERDNIESVLADEAANLSRYLDMSKLQAGVSRFRQGELQTDGVIWTGYTLALWLKQRSSRTIS